MVELTREFAEDFAREWIGAWNDHDLERVFPTCAGTPYKGLGSMRFAGVPTP